MEASIIVCTLDRNETLAKTLNSLLEQTLTPDRYEIIVVDNGPQNSTRQLVDTYTNKGHINLHYMIEPQKGLSHARNRGIKESMGKIIAFIDDDAQAERDWLVNLFPAFEDKNVYCVGGLTKAIWPAPRPEWLSDWLLAYLAVTEQKTPPKDNEYSFPYYPIGTNMAFRKQAFLEFGEFTHKLGRIGSSLLSNEENEFCLRLEKAGKSLRYASGAVVYHNIAAERLSKDWFYNRLFSQGQSDAVLDILHNTNIIDRIQNTYIAKILSYCSGGHSKFSTECLYKEALGYISQILEQAFLKGGKELEATVILDKIFKSVCSDHHESQHSQPKINNMSISYLISLARKAIRRFKSF